MPIASTMRRLGQMDGTELSFRARTWARRTADRAAAVVRPPRWRRRQLATVLRPVSPELDDAIRAIRSGDWADAQGALARHFVARPPRFPIGPDNRHAIVSRIRARFPWAAREAVALAERILAGRYDLLGYRGLRFDAARLKPGTTDEVRLKPDPTNVASSNAASQALVGSGFSRTHCDIDWHWDPVHRKRAPFVFWSAVPYLDPACGDHKIIWELNRHQHWLALGRALWLLGGSSGSPAAAAARAGIKGQLRSWLAANPPLTGINWASMLELALRSLSWIWALHFLVGDSDAAGLKTRPTLTGAETRGLDDDATDEDPWLVDLLLGLDRQLTHVERNLSRYFSPNTHLLGEGLALYVAGRTLPELVRSERYEDQGRRVLLDEMDRQILEDGGHAERSPHYHRYALDFYLLALAVGRVTGDPDVPRFADAVGRMADFARALADDGGRLPNLGDDDGGQLFPIGGRNPDSVRDTLGAAAVLLRRPELALGELPEEVWWLAGRWAPEELAGRVFAGAAARPDSAGLEASGYFVSRSRRGDRLVFDAGRHGFLNGGHAHADALALTLDVANRPVLVDTGTATYTTDPSVRDRFRTTAAHNTLVLDGRSQSEPAGPFGWRRSADARLHVSRFNPAFDYFEASHDGYAPVGHRRAILTFGDGRWLVADHLTGTGRHRADLHWHLAPGLLGDVLGPGVVRIGPARRPLWMLSPGLQVRSFRGSDTGLGWCSPVYGALVPIDAIRMTRDGAVPFSVVTVLTEEEPQVTPGVVEVAATGVEPGIPRIAVRLTRARDIHLAFFSVPSRDPLLSTIGGDLQTDARVLHVRFEAGGRPLALTLVDGSFVRKTSAPAFELVLARRVPDFHVGIDAFSVRPASAGAVPDFRFELEPACVAMGNAEWGMGNQ